MLNRQVFSWLTPSKHPVTLAAVLTMVAIALMVPQCGLAQVPDMTGSWQGDLAVNSGTISMSSYLSSNPQTSTCNSGSNCTQVTLQFSDGSTITAAGTLSGSSFTNGSFTQTDSSGRWTTGSSSGTLSSSVISLNFAGTRSDGVTQNGNSYSENYSQPPPDPGGGCGGTSEVQTVCMVM